MNRIAVLLALVLVGCTDEGESRKALENQGFTDIEFHGYAPFTCSESDSYSTKFRAKNTKGQQVEGVVCCGVLKGCTVRW